MKAVLWPHPTHPSRIVAFSALDKDGDEVPPMNIQTRGSVSPIHLHCVSDCGGPLSIFKECFRSVLISIKMFKYLLIWNIFTYTAKSKYFHPRPTFSNNNYKYRYFTIIDHSKACDLINHDIFINTLFNIVISPSIVRWVATFSKVQSQRVKWEENFLKWNFHNAGVPQGTILGPNGFADLKTLMYLCINMVLTALFSKYINYDTILISKSQQLFWPNDHRTIILESRTQKQKKWLFFSRNKSMHCRYCATCLY